MSSAVGLGKHTQININDKIKSVSQLDISIYVQRFCKSAINVI